MLMSFVYVPVSLSLLVSGTQRSSANKTNDLNKVTIRWVINQHYLIYSVKPAKVTAKQQIKMLIILQLLSWGLKTLKSVCTMCTVHTQYYAPLC